MKLYEMAVVTQVVMVRANSEDEAEAKYGAYFNEEECPCGAPECECVNDSEDTYHITTEIGEENE
jgi:hypothetical protein